MKVLTSDENLLYKKSIDLIYQIKLVQGGQALQSTLRRHKKFTRFLIEKQITELDKLESYLDNSDEKTIDLN